MNIGQKLKIPTKTDTENTINYIVQSGDTLYKIANRYNTTVAQLMKLNDLTSNLLSVGQNLLIPSNNNIDNNTNDTENIYIVQSGDTLYGIANKFNITVDELRKINNITTNTLSIGQMLKIPTVNSYTYTVQGGDTLYSIANKFNTTVADLINKNDLTSTLLSVGQILQL